MNDRTNVVLGHLRPRFEAIYGGRLEQLVLFGSEARGHAEPGSDIDLMVVLEGPVHPGTEIARTGETVSALSLEHDVVLSCTFVSAEHMRRSKARSS